MCSPTLLLLSCQQSGYCPRDSESLALLIEWVLVWNTHTRTHAETYIHPRTHTLVTLLQMEGGRGMSVRPRVMGEHQSLPVSLAFFFFFFLPPPPPPPPPPAFFFFLLCSPPQPPASPPPLTFLLPHWSAFVLSGGVCVCVCVRVCAENAVGPHGQDAVLFRRCYRSQPAN